MWMRVGVRMIVLVVFAVVMSALWLGGYVAMMSAFNQSDLAADLPEFINEALAMSGPALCAAAAAWWLVTRRASRSGTSGQTAPSKLLATLMVIWACVTGLFISSNGENFRGDSAAYLLTPSIMMVAMVIGGVALWRWVISPSGQRSSARAGAIRGALAAQLTVIFLIVAVIFTVVVVAAVMSAPRAGLWGFLAAWYLIGTPLGWFGVPITTAVGALYGALVHRVIGAPDASPDEPPLARLADVTLAP